MAWITSEDVYNDWIQAVNGDGDFVGFIRQSEARRQDIKILTIEKPEKYKKDPYISYHAEMLVRSGVLTNGRDLNDVQSILLLSYIIKEKEDAAEDKQGNFEQLLFASNPELYKAYKEYQQQQEMIQNPEYQQLRPKSLQELLSMFDAFDEETPSDQDKDQTKPAGWLDDILDEEEISQIRD